MEWIDALRGEVVGIDTAPLIYFIEKHPSHAAKLKPFFAAAEQREFRIVTSIVTLLEVLVHPLRSGRDDLVREYRGYPSAVASFDRLGDQRRDRGRGGSSARLV